MDNVHKRDDVQVSENMSAPPLPPKYVMLNETNGLRPPPQRRNPPRYPSYQDRSSSGNCCLKCICFCYCCLFFLIIAVSIAGYVIYATFKIDIPKYRIEEFKVEAFNVLPDLSLNTEINVIVRAENPSDLISLQYEKGSSVTMNYIDKTICSGKVSEFYQGYKSIKRINIPLQGKTEFSSGFQESLAEDKKQGKIPLLIVVKAPIIVELGRIPLKEVVINVNISMIVDSLEKDKKIGIISSSYKYGLLWNGLTIHITFFNTQFDAILFWEGGGREKQSSIQPVCFIFQRTIQILHCIVMDHQLPINETENKYYVYVYRRSLWFKVRFGDVYICLLIF